MQGMRDLLRDRLRQSLRAMTPLDRLAAAWPVACGKSMAAHGTLTALTDGTLHILVTDDAWLSQMISMRSILQHDLARVAGVPLAGIHFEKKR
jgi:hypothetical protein